MLDQLISAAYLPFSIAGGVMIGLLGLEIAFALLGKPLSALLDHLAPGHGAGPGLDGHGLDGHGADAAGGHAVAHVDTPAYGKFGEALAWLNAGRVPGLILLILALAWFSAGGFVVQGVAEALWRPLPGGLAVLAALLVAVVPMRASSRLVGRIFPRDETYVSSHGDFVGMTGIVTLGPVQKGSVAKARFRDQYGNVHFPRVEPFREGEIIEQGAPVLAIEARGPAIAVARAKPTLTGRID